MSKLLGMIPFVALLLSLSCLAPESGLKKSSHPPTADVLPPDFEQAKANYQEYCASCHGEKMDAFVDRKWQYGNTGPDLIKAIKTGYPDDGMPAYDTTFTDQEIADLADFILTGIKNLERFDFEDTALSSDTFSTASVDFHLDTVVSDLDVPWGMAFLPDGDLLITERSGTLYRRKPDHSLEKIKGVPEVRAKGQGGLLDVAVHPSFAQNNWIYLSFSKPNAAGTKSTTAIMRAVLKGNRLRQQEILFEAQPYSTTRHHYGSRLEFDREGYLFFSVGDRGKRQENPQSLANHCGKIHRIHDDGRIPRDNPFVGVDTALASIYSYGHRNPQGVTLEPATGRIWTHEHGPRGGDEVNIIRKGHNYGWPVISYGINYNGTTFTNRTEKEGMDQPVLYWIPSIAPCGMDFVTGDRYKGWEGDLLVGSLRYKYLNRCKVVGDEIVEEEMLMKNIGRVRNVRMGPDGYIYVAVEKPGAIYRLVPIEENIR